MEQELNFGPEDAVERIVSGLFRDYHLRLTSHARRIVGNSEDAFDVVQDTFIAAYRTLLAAPDRTINSHWLYATARNRSITLLRKRKMRGQVPLIEGLDEAFAEDHLLVDLPAALKRLPREQAIPIVITCYYGFTSSEAAMLLGLAPAAVRQRVCRGLKKVRAALEVHVSPSGTRSQVF